MFLREELVKLPLYLIEDIFFSKNLVPFWEFQVGSWGAWDNFRLYGCTYRSFWSKPIFLESVTDCSANYKDPIIQVWLVPTSKLFLLANTHDKHLKTSIFYFHIGNQYPVIFDPEVVQSCIFSASLPCCIIHTSTFNLSSNLLAQLSLSRGDGLNDWQFNIYIPLTGLHPRCISLFNSSSNQVFEDTRAPQLDEPFCGSCSPASLFN